MKMDMNIELETINKLYLELSQVATAKTKRELEELVRSACAIAERKGEHTHWGRFINSVNQAGLNGVTARVYRILESDLSQRQDQRMSAERIGMPDTCINCGKTHEPGECEAEHSFAASDGSATVETHWACACVKCDRKGKLKSIKLHPIAKTSCRVCGAKQRPRK